MKKSLLFLTLSIATLQIMASHEYLTRQNTEALHQEFLDLEERLSDLHAFLQENYENGNYQTEEYLREQIGMVADRMGYISDLLRHLDQ